MTIGSLFSGLEAFGHAFELEGFKLLWSCENEPSCQKLIRQKFQRSLLHGDIRGFEPDHYECPDVITFGFPCQSLSVAGQRKGLAEKDRSGLFYEASRIIKGFVSRGLQFALAENVPGLFSSDGGRDFARIIGSLGQCGALDIAWRTLDAQWFGLAQRRKRVFIVADFRGQRAEEILSVRESLCGHPAPSREKGERTSCPIAGCSNGGGANGPGRTADDTESLNVGTLAASGACNELDFCIPVVANPIGHHHRRDDLDNDTYICGPAGG